MVLRWRLPASAGSLAFVLALGLALAATVAGLAVDGAAGPFLQALAAVVPGVVAVAVSARRLPGRPRAQRCAWVVQATGLLLITLGYVVFHRNLTTGADPGYPLPADVLFVPGGLLVLTSGLLLNRRTPDTAASVDAGIAVTGAAVAVTAVLVRPTLDGDAGALSVALTTVYPALDLLNLALVLRLWLAGRAAGGPAALLAAAFGCLLFGDSAFGVLVQVAPVDLRRWFGVPFQVALLLIAAAVAHPRSDELGTGLPRPRTWSRGHWLMVGGASCVPPSVVLAQGFAGVPVDWAVTGIGALVLSALSVTRVHHAVTQVQRQAAVLAGLARTDELTGLPNRRSWDAELSRALARDVPLAVALLDLDHFKRLNDSQGHAAGDRVLQEAAASWQAALPAGVFLARHGGEEFALLVPGELVPQAVDLVERLRAACPGPQTVSIGLAHATRGEGAGELMGRVDAELYRAKAAGRDRVCVAAAPNG